MKIEIITNRHKITFNNMLLIVFLMVTLSLSVSCKKFVQVPPPITQLATTSVFANNATATSAVTYIYSQMDNYAYPVSLYAGLSADEFLNYSTSISQQQIYANAIEVTTNTSYSTLWTQPYKYIYQTNAIIDGLQQYSGTSPGVNRQLTGEAKFLRAFFHFNLTNFFGDVPLVLTTDYPVTDKLARTPRLQVLQQVIADLQDAQSKLNSNYVDVSDTTATTERVRANKSAAAALLARAYLYLADYSNHDITQYANAESQATMVINNTLNTNSYYSLSPLSGANSVFKANSSETILALQTVLPTSNFGTAEGNGFILVAASRNVAVSTQLLNSFEANDQRKSNWIGSFTGASPSITYYFPYKYKDRNGVTTASEYSIVLRLAEQYLIRAEARAQQGKISGATGALADLNLIRTRAGLPNYNGLTDKTSVLAAILHERQVELFSEWGHRWFDLIRTGNANAVMGNPGNVCQAKGGSWSPNWQLYPILQADRTIDPNLTQNPGY